MSAGQLVRNRTLSMGSGRSSNGRNASLADFGLAQTGLVRDFEPSDATASMFLYAQGNSVVVAHHDTLTIERRFSRHTEEVQLLAVDNVSERGAGRLVISYDAGQTAIVWDLMTGDEVARFASYNNLSVAAWMRNGNVAFGNAQGNVILFEPSTSEHISARTIDQIPITALSPAADCRTYAIGYQNGSLLICTLQPRFTIIHNLTTSRSPSPVVTLAWHTSSSKQKSDMLATQTQDGDLRVWSIVKNHSSNEPAKVVRILKRSERFQPGPNWLGWSKNGRIIQYSEGETSSWDVRTKHVTYENVPTLEHVKGIAIYGPGATMFTLGANNTAQQFDLNSPPVLVANVQHPANLLPPSPPVSIEEQKKGIVTMRADGLSSIPINVDIVSESDDDHMSPLARIAREMDKIEERQQVPDRSGALSPVSSQASFTSRSSAASRPPHKQGSVRSKGMSDHTVMSLGSSLHSREPSVVSSRDSFSMSSVSSTQSSRSRPSARGSRLRQEVLRSPEEKVVVDLFKFTKSRLSDLPYRAPQVPDGTPKTTTDLRRQMLSTIFGWEGEADGLIRDELSRHPRGSASGLLLTKWLGDIDTDIMATSSQSMTSSDWMLLALSGIGGQASQQKVARAYIQRLLEKGDVHTAATIMIGMGDQNDAIEIYVSHRRYMEALVLTCYVYPADWGRQAQLIRKWGEWAVQHSQQALAIRCFSCTGSESSEPYFSPPPQTITFSQRNSNIPEMLSPPLSPPGVVPRGPQRNMAKQAALKLVTSFGEKNSKAKYFGADGDKTPMNNIGVTPIAESALSPGGGDQTAFLRGQRSAFNTPATATARTATPGGFTRARLPSIGEMPTDVTPVMKKTGPPSVSSASEGSSSEYDNPKRGHSRKRSQPETLQLNATAFQPGSRAATASPMMQRTMNERAAHPLPPPSSDAFSRTKEAGRLRNGSRDRKPQDLHLQWPPMSDILTGDYMTTPELSATSSRHRTPTARSVTGSVTGSVSSVSQSGRRSPTMSERSYKSHGITTPLTGRSLEPYFSSLEAAQQTVKPKQRSRQASRDPADSKPNRGRSSSRKPKAREPSEERGRSAVRYVKSGKRSPTSPVPMSPDELREIGYDDDQSETTSISGTRRVKARDGSAVTVKLRSRQASRVRQLSPEPLKVDTRSRTESKTRTASRKVSPDASYTRGGRGRSKLRDGSGMRSPSSPLPMSPDAVFDKIHRKDPDSDGDDLRAAQADQENFKSRQRSVSRARERGTSAVRHISPKRREPSRTRLGNVQDGNESREEPRRAPRATSQSRAASDLKAGDLQKIKLERQRKKESAAKELEERRRSLTRRPSAPPITHPEELSPMVFRPASRSELKSTSYSPAQLPTRSQTVSPESMRMADANRSSPMQIGLPATPRAMQHPKFDPDNKDIPDVPQIPDTYTPMPQVTMGSLDEFAGSDTLPKTTFAPLPKTTYQAAPRHIPPRSMSAPIPEEPMSPHALPATLPTHPAFHAALPPSNRRRNLEALVDEKSTQPTRKINPGESGPGTIGYEARNNAPLYSAAPMVIGGIEETLASSTFLNDGLVPPPPPPAPAPPILKELQHLALPPPPPPAPLYHGQGSPAQLAPSAVIEIVMDEDAPAPTRTTPPQEATVPGTISHTRGRSQNDNSISGRLSRATERMRSASRGAPPQLSRTKSPPVSPPMIAAPYESIPTAKWVLDQMQNRATNQVTSQQAPVTERHPREVKADMMEGGMI